MFPNHLGKPTEFIVKHIPTGNSPRGIVVSPDGRTAYVANALDDSLTVIDVEKLEAVGRDGPGRAERHYPGAARRAAVPQCARSLSGASSPATPAIPTDT